MNLFLYINISDAFFGGNSVAEHNKLISQYLK